MTLDITFRPCKPDDVDLAVPLIYSSGPAAFDYVFSDQKEGESLAFLRTAFVETSTAFSHRAHIAALLDGKVVGVGTMFLADQHFSFTVGAIKAFLRFYRPMGVLRTIRRGLNIEKVIQPPKKGIGIIAHLGVAPEHRSKGIGEKLIDHLVDQLREKNIETAALDVAVTNPRAYALYKRIGFLDSVTRKSDLNSRFGHVVDHIYMEMPIEKRT